MNKVIIFDNAYNRNCVPLLENAGILNKFDLIASAEVSKDKVEKFKLMRNKYGKNILFITDSLGDVRDADIAGISTIVVSWGFMMKKFLNKKNMKTLFVSLIP
ncbi:MAG: hypothetical protein WD963_01965 [Candidatus Paceibacterota bacterium]